MRERERGRENKVKGKGRFKKKLTNSYKISMKCENNSCNYFAFKNEKKFILIKCGKEARSKAREREKRRRSKVRYREK